MVISTKVTREQQKLLDELTRLGKAADAKIKRIEAKAEADKQKALAPVREHLVLCDYALISMAKEKAALGITDHNTFKKLYPEQSDKLTGR